MALYRRFNFSAMSQIEWVLLSYIVIPEILHKTEDNPLEPDKDFWVPDISGIGGPRYLALAGAIANAINSGALPAGTQLPPQRDLALKLGITVGTVGRAYMVVKMRDLVSGEVGRGTFVKNHEDMEKYTRFLPEPKPGTIDLACFRFPIDDMIDATRNVLSEVADHTMLLPLVSYPPAAGYIAHRAAGSAWIRRLGFEVPPEQIIACGGGQQAILTATMSLAHFGGPFLTEQLTYSGLKSIAALREIDLEGVEMDAEGMMPDALLAAHKRTGGRIVFLQPTAQNPLGSVMSENRRKKIAKIGRAHDLIFVEDDVVAAGTVDRPPPLAVYAPERTIYFTSLSKCVSPALRVGYMAVPPGFVDEFTNTIHALTLATSPLIHDAASLMIMYGTAEKIAQRNNEELARRHKIAAEELKGVKLRSHPSAFFSWLCLPDHWSSSEFLNSAQKAGVSVVKSESFSIGQIEPPRAVRISLNPDSNKLGLVEGLRILKKVVKQRPSPQFTVV